jgi:hypothetical protein
MKCTAEDFCQKPKVHWTGSSMEVVRYGMVWLEKRNFVDDKETKVEREMASVLNFQKHTRQSVSDISCFSARCGRSCKWKAKVGFTFILLLRQKSRCNFFNFVYHHAVVVD